MAQRMREIDGRRVLVDAGAWRRAIEITAELGIADAEAADAIEAAHESAVDFESGERFDDLHGLTMALAVEAERS